METLNKQTNPFDGTVLASSYLPVFIATSPQDKNSEVTLSNGTTISVKYFDPWTAVGIYPIPYHNYLSKIWNLWDYLNSLLKSFTKEQKLKEIRTDFNKFVNQSTKNFSDYKELHEKYLEKMQTDIGIINRYKTLMKGYLLYNLFRKLQEMGIECSYSDFQDELIDLRDFPINENYDLMAKENLSTIATSNATLEDIINGLMNIFNIFINRFINNSKIKKIEEKLKELEKKERYNIAQMNADLSLLEVLEKALKNIARIYADIVDNIRPIMEKLLTKLSSKYNNDFSQMPQQEVEALRTTKDLLKDLSEVTIVPTKSDINKMKEMVVNYSNNLSTKHYELKFEMLKYVS
jgi:ElaB/YqjD/DUF883 family membrane-anchored ribosome-binding protein